MNSKDIIDKLIKASDVIQKGTLKDPWGHLGYYGLIIEDTHEDTIKVVLNWFKENIPIGIKLYERNGQSYFHIKERTRPTKKYIIYLYEDI